MKIPIRTEKFHRRLSLALGFGFAIAGANSSALAQTAAPTAAPAAASAEAAPASVTEQNKATDFVRFVESEEGSDGIDRLETVVRSYRKGDQQVDLVSVVHIADSTYYEAMNEYLAGYDVVLYEMVGGPVEERDLDAPEAEPALSGIHVAQGLMQRLLALDYQIDGIDYSGANFVHADVDWNEYSELMATRDQSMATLFQRAMAISLSGQEVPGVPTDNAESMAMLSGLLRSITSGDANGLKRIVAPMLGEAEVLISLIEGDDGTVIVTERNKVVMRSVDEQLSAGKKTLGIFYGAGHMPDLEQRLLDAGFEAAGVEWMTAWEIGAKPAGAITDGKAEDGSASVAPQDAGDAFVNAIGFFGEILQDKELMRSVVSGVRALTDSGPEEE